MKAPASKRTTGSTSTPARPAVERVKSETAVAKPRVKPAGPQITKLKTTAAGKVVIDKRSLPQSKLRTSSIPVKPKTSGAAYKGPIAVGGSEVKPAGGYKPHGGYEGPLNLKGVAPLGLGKKTTHQNASNTTVSRPGGAAYQGPLSLGSLV
jgi:hypothetical protein